MPSLESTTTWELETLAGRCSRADSSPRLTELERSAILKGIAAELSNRAAARKSGHMQATETDRLQALIEDKESDLYFLGCQLDDGLEGTAESESGPESKPAGRQEGECR